MKLSNELRYGIALTLVPKIGDVLVKQLISYVGSAEQIFNESAAKLAKIPGIGDTLAQSIKSSQTLADADSIIKEAANSNTSLLLFNDPNYPKRLKSVQDAPALLYWQGNGDLNAARTVGIVGTRNSTEYGSEITHEIVEGLSKRGATVVSGLAYGIDICAHKACLAMGVPTIGVMANGMNKIYPSAHKTQALKMREMGGLLTENSFNALPDAPQFPKRNRIIAALSDAVIVVEGAEKGGALITAEYANNYHKDVFAVPGRITDTFSRGCNKLIKAHKAHIYSNIKDIDYIMDWNTNSTPSLFDDVQTPDFSNFDLDEREKLITEIFGTNDSFTMDEISRKTQIPINQLAVAMLGLEFKGLVKTLPGNSYKLNSKMHLHT